MMRRKEHSNRFKRLRRTVNELVAAAAGNKPYRRKAVRYAVYETIAVPSHRYKMKIGDEVKDMAIQVRMQAGSPRRIYQEAKRNVQDNRRA